MVGNGVVQNLGTHSPAPERIVTDNILIRCITGRDRGVYPGLGVSRVANSWGVRRGYGSADGGLPRRHSGHC